MRFKTDFFFNYVKNAPLPLAIERSMECEIMSRQAFARPILDIGCGDGLFAHVLFDEQIDVGIDPNGRELERAKKYGICAELIRCCGSHIPKDSGSFHTILSNSVLEHIPELQPVLEEAFRLLAPGGKFYVTIPTDRYDTYTLCYQLLSLSGFSSFADKYRRFFNRFWKHFHYHSREEWEHIFKNSGFQVIQFQEYGSMATCLMCNLLVPLAGPSFITKKIINRWILLTTLRQFYIYPFYLLAKALIRRTEKSNGGGVIFFALTKK